MMTGTPTLLTVDDALAADTPELALKAHVLEAIRSLVPASFLLFAALTPRLAPRAVVVLQARPLTATLTEIWERYIADARHHDPFASPPLPAGPVAVLADVDAGEAYLSFLERSGIGDFAAMYLRVSGRLAGVIGLARSATAPPFSRQDAMNLRRLQPLVEHAYEAAVGPRPRGTIDLLAASGLSLREIEVAQRIAHGASNAEVGRSLHISEATVKTHLSHIYAKLGIASRTQLAILAGASTTFG